MTVELREARLIFPLGETQHPQLQFILGCIRLGLSANFNGYTEFSGTGSDGEEVEPVVIFDVAVPNDTASAFTLRRLALIICNGLDQDATYLRMPDGTVELVSRDTAHPNGQFKEAM